MFVASSDTQLDNIIRTSHRWLLSAPWRHQKTPMLICEAPSSRSDHSTSVRGMGRDGTGKGSQSQSLIIIKFIICSANYRPLHAYTTTISHDQRARAIHILKNRECVEKCFSYATSSFRVFISILHNNSPATTTTTVESLGGHNSLRVCHSPQPSHKSLIEISYSAVVVVDGGY